MPSRHTFRLEDSPSRSPNLDHCRVAPVVAWVASLNIGLNSTLGLIMLVSCIGVGKWKFEERGPKDMSLAC
jgi:hypothetical protein